LFFKNCYTNNPLNASNRLVINNFQLTKPWRTYNLIQTELFLWVIAVTKKSEYWIPQKYYFIWIYNS